MAKKKHSTPKLPKKFRVSTKNSDSNGHTVAVEKVKKTSTFWSWLDDNILLLLTGFLFAFIPLYPKIPLAELIPGYIVRLRLEDLFVGVAVLVLGVQLLRKKATLPKSFLWLIGAYAVVGLLSTASAVLITKTVPAELIHVGKTLLHYFRYLQYFSLFFLAYAAIKKKKDVWLLLAVFCLTVIAITIYGYGQKFHYWPVYSTMNREFSKGLRLYLTEHARVQSTFGGHYDMAGYLVIALPVLLALFFATKKKVGKAFWGIGFLAGVWLLIMSASRTSFVAFLGGVGVALLMFAWTKPKILPKIWWFITRSVLVGTIVMYMFFQFGESIYERFLQTLAAYPQLSDTYHYVNDRRRHFYRDYIHPLLENSGVTQIALLPASEPPKDGMSTDELERVLVSSDTRPSTTDPSTGRPADVYEDIPDVIWEATEEGGVTVVRSREVPRTFSDNAQRYGLSLAIRLDTLWPRALNGFYSNPLLGSGYATLTKDTVVQFTEAESTDNNFLRTLGETGLLGFVTFYGVVILAAIASFRLFRVSTDLNMKAIAIGFLAASFALALNAVYIDVYAASKIAFTYWALTGIIMAAALKLQGIELDVERWWKQRKHAQTTA